MPIFKNVLTFQKHFVARDSDILIASVPKAGSTWLKALLFSIVSRTNQATSQSPLLNHHPQEVVCSLESGVYSEAFGYPCPQHLDELVSPRLFSTHVPYTSLPESIKTSRCRILYICRESF
ncbi:Cytosolic sulfotransferase 13 [Bienertia sinuspersici]